MIPEPAFPMLRRTGASEYLRRMWGISRTPKTLAKLAVIGGGPRFHVDGRIPLYPPEELDAWAISKLGKLRDSTSDRGLENNPDPLQVPDAGFDRSRAPDSEPQEMGA